MSKYKPTGRPRGRPKGWRKRRIPMLDTLAQNVEWLADAHREKGARHPLNAAYREAAGLFGDEGRAIDVETVRRYVRAARGGLRRRDEAIMRAHRAALDRLEPNRRKDAYARFWASTIVAAEFGMTFTMIDAILKRMRRKPG